MDIDEIRTPADWATALTQAPRHDCYHTWGYHRIAQGSGEGEPLLFAVRTSRGGLLLPLLERAVAGSTRRDLTSVYGYPSPLAWGELTADTLARLWEQLLAHLARRGYVSLFSRCHPLLTPALPGETLQRSGPVVLIDLDRPEQEQLGDYRDNHRRDLRKLARLGVACHAEAPGEALAEFVANYEATMRNLQAEPYYFFPPRYYRELLAAPSFDARLYTCRLDGQAICSGLFIFCGDFVQYHLGGTAPAFAALAPTKLMFDSVRRDAAREGRRHFCLGGGLGCREDSLFNFKAGFSRQTRDFCLIRKILDPEEYQRLSARVPNQTHYFPCYRALPA